MSARKMSLAFTIQARKDHTEILLYSLETWGPDQHGRYEALLDRVIRQIQTFPDAGRACPEILPDGRCRPVGQHMIYYSVATHVVTIHRILHQSRHVTPSLMLSEAED